MDWQYKLKHTFSEKEYWWWLLVTKYFSKVFVKIVYNIYTDWDRKTSNPNVADIEVSKRINLLKKELIDPMVMVSLVVLHVTDDRRWKTLQHPRQSWGQCPWGHVFQHSDATEKNQKCSQILLEEVWLDGRSHSDDIWSCNKKCICIHPSYKPRFHAIVFELQDLVFRRFPMLGTIHIRIIWFKWVLVAKTSGGVNIK